ncbi:MAG: adenylosuccinate lyase [Pseudomonadota bacterium]
MTLKTLYAVSPIDGRYHEKTQSLSEYASEAALIRYRLVVEIEWLIFLSEHPEIPEVTEFTPQLKSYLRSIASQYSMEDALKIKDFEKTTQHDVKAVEYFLKEKLSTHSAFLPYLEFIHFACTSEDINNIAYALMFKDLIEHILNPNIKQLLQLLTQLAHQNADVAMLARTHGQPATPTTLGKEFANTVARLQRQHILLSEIKITAKINGATGNFNAHTCAYPQVNWLLASKNFIEHFGLSHNPYTTQIEPHDYIAEFSHALVRINTILIDFSRDIWGYIAIDYFKQIKKSGEVGSSTMPHKINPIDFENAEGNLGMANALFNFFAEKLPISRWQRDLSDSTVLRNIGVAVAHSTLAYSSLQAGLKKLTVNAEQITNDLNQHWEVLTEAIQTVLRKYGIQNPYEQLKEFSQGKLIQAQDVSRFIQTLDLPLAAKQELMELTPATYIGLAAVLAKNI